MGAQLADLKFSSDSMVLMGITDPFSPQGGQGMQYEVMTWDVVSGQRYPPLERRTTVRSLGRWNDEFFDISTGIRRYGKDLGD